MQDNKAIITANEITNQHLVMKDNSLIMSSYTLSVEEQRLILACIEKAQRKQAPLKSEAIEITFSVNEYANIYNVHMATAYKTLKTASDKLYERSITIDDEGLTRNVRWLQEKAIYDSGRVKLTFSSTVSKHIRDIVTERSIYSLEQATQLRSQYAIRFFEIFKMVIDPETQEGSWEVTLDKLKELFEIKDLYSRWVDLKKRVIVDSLQQINQNTSLKVDFEISAKNGRQVSAVRFTIFESSQLTLGIS
jgi:plasmid replication initiation protein